MKRITLEFDPRSGHVRFVAEKVSLGQVSSKYFDFPFQFSLHRLHHTHAPSSGAGIISQIVVAVPNVLSTELIKSIPRAYKLNEMETVPHLFP
jgi:hypothetical protein